MDAAKVPACLAKCDTLRWLLTMSYFARTFGHQDVWLLPQYIHNRVRMCWLQAPAGLTTMLAAGMHNYSIIQATINGELRTTGCLKRSLRLQGWSVPDLQLPIFKD